MQHHVPTTAQDTSAPDATSSAKHVIAGQHTHQLLNLPTLNSFLISCKKSEAIVLSQLQSKLTREFAALKANLSPAEYEEADSHIPGHQCSSCDKFRQYLELKILLREWEEWKNRY
jgi:hypothetical protein